MKRVSKRMKEIGMWRIFALISGAIAVAAVGFTFYVKNTQEPAEPPKVSHITGRPIVVSEQSKAELVELLKGEELIVAAAIVQVDLVKNRRDITFFYSNRLDIQTIWNEYFARMETNPVIPAFGSGEAARFNPRITNIINGNFDCRKFNETVGFKQFPALNKHAPWICAIAIPPSFDGSGDFVGFLNFYMSQRPDDTALKQLTGKVTALSTSIFNRDIAGDKDE